MTRVLAGGPVAGAIRGEVARGVRELLAAGGRPPGLAAVLMGDDPASRVYVGSKARASEQAGFRSRVLQLTATAAAAELFAAVDRLNADDETDGILVQLPLPRAIPVEAVLERVSPDKDVDGFHPLNVGRLWRDQKGPAPATAVGIVELLRRSKIPLSGRRAVIVGRSAIVGKPLAALLLREHCTVTMCHSRTRDLADVCREAEILIAAIGRPAFFGPGHVGPGAVVVDVGINRVSDPKEVERLFPGDRERRRRLEERGSVLVGDVDYRRVAPIASAITPVPGGVGPLTVAMLLANTLEASRRRQGLPA